MAFQLYRFPMSHGVVTDGGRNFLGLVKSQGEAAFVLYDLEKNDIVHKLQYMDTTDWRLNKQLEDHPAGVSGCGAYFVSDYLIDDSQGEGFRKPCGMDVRVYDKASAALLDTIPVSEDTSQWVINGRLLTMARLEDDFYLVVFSEKARSERDFVIRIYDSQNREFSELWRSSGHQARYFDVTFQPDTLHITVKQSEEFFYDVFSRNEYDLYTLQLAEDYGKVELISEQHVAPGKEDGVLLPGLSCTKQKRGFLRGKVHQYVEVATGHVLLEMKEGMNTACEHVVAQALGCVIVEKTGVMGGSTTYYIIEGVEEEGYRLTHTIDMNGRARICVDDAAGTLALVGEEESCVLRQATCGR